MPERPALIAAQAEPFHWATRCGEHRADRGQGAAGVKLAVPHGEGVHLAADVAAGLAPAGAVPLVDAGGGSGEKPRLPATVPPARTSAGRDHRGGQGRPGGPRPSGRSLFEVLAVSAGPLPSFHTVMAVMTASGWPAVGSADQEPPSHLAIPFTTCSSAVRKTPP